MSNPVSEMIENAMKNMQHMIDVNSVIGQPIRPDSDTLIIPVAKVTCGFGGGGSDIMKNQGVKAAAETTFAGGIGGGTSVKTEAFLVISGGNVRIVPVDMNATTMDKIVDMVPGMVDKVSGFFAKKNKKENTDEYNTAG